MLKKFLGFLVSKRRFFYVEKILNDFLFICSNARGEIQAELSAAKNLNENEINNIKNELSSTFGSNIKLNCNIVTTIASMCFIIMHFVFIL